MKNWNWWKLLEVLQQNKLISSKLVTPTKYTWVEMNFQCSIIQGAVGKVMVQV